MTDTSTPPEGAPQPDPATPQPAPALRVLSQYIRDLSFENPGNRPAETQPNIDLSIDVGATPHSSGNSYEVALKMTAVAKSGETTLFVCELDYCGLFQLQNAQQAQIEPLLLIECPRLLFPFARRIIADVTREGGFPPLMIDPVDFVALYQSQKQQQANAPTAQA